MKLTEIILFDTINPALISKKRDDSIQELLEGLVQSGVLTPTLKDDYFKKILKRERKGSTGIGKGVAIPHVKDSTIKSVKVTIGIHAQGIDFNALDREPVQIIFLVLSPEENPEEHLKAMESIVNLLSQESFRRFIKQSKTKEDIKTLLYESENDLI